jgi:hypothetical protein
MVEIECTRGEKMLSTAPPDRSLSDIRQELGALQQN